MSKTWRKRLAEPRVPLRNVAYKHKENLPTCLALFVIWFWGVVLEMTTFSICVDEWNVYLIPLKLIRKNFELSIHI